MTTGPRTWALFTGSACWTVTDPAPLTAASPPTTTEPPEARTPAAGGTTTSESDSHGGSP